MTEKISIFDVEISCIKAKEAMMQAIEFMKGDSVNTIELVSMESLMKEHENPEWKKKVKVWSTLLGLCKFKAVPAILWVKLISWV